MANTPLTPESVQNALTQLSQWFPEQANTINQYQGEIAQNILNNTAPLPGSALSQIPAPATPAASAPAVNPAMTAATAAFMIPGHAVPQAADLEMFAVSDIFTPCEEAIGLVLVDVGFFMLSLAGLQATANLNVTRALLSEIGPAPLNGFLSMIQNFRAAPTAYAQAKVIFSIGGALWKVSGFSIILKAWKDQATWFDWIKSGVVAVAQLIVWFASDGVAFIAQAAIAMANAANLIADVVKAVQICTSNNCTPAAPSASSTTTFLPAGSFSYTASNVAVTVTAICKLQAGGTVASTLDITQLPLDTAIQNINGSLQQSPNEQIQQPSIYTPQGSYLQTSQNIKVVLTADCKAINGNTISSSIEITELSTSQTISNINGLLTVDN